MSETSQTLLFPSEAEAAVLLVWRGCFALTLSFIPEPFFQPSAIGHRTPLAAGRPLCFWIRGVPWRFICLVLYLRCLPVCLPACAACRPAYLPRSDLPRCPAALLVLRLVAQAFSTFWCLLVPVLYNIWYPHRIVYPLLFGTFRKLNSARATSDRSSRSLLGPSEGCTIQLDANSAVAINHLELV